MATSTTRRPVLQGDVLQHSDPTVRDFARQVAAGLGQAVTLQDHRGGTMPVRINTAGSVSALEVHRNGEWTSIGASSVSRSGSSGRTVVYASGDDSGASIDHNALSNRQGGRDDGTLGLREDYHLTAAEYAGTWGHKLYAISAEMNVPLTAVRASSATDGSYCTLWLTHRTSGDMVDGFGAYVGFCLEDAGQAETMVGKLAVVRAGADNTGDFVWSPAAAGVIAEKMRLTSAGRLSAVSFSAGAGSAAAPSINFGGTDGLYLAGTGDLGLSISGAAKWRFVATALYPMVSGAMDIGLSDRYVANIFGSKHYLNSTAYLDGATAGKVNLTGSLQTSSTVLLKYASGAPSTTLSHQDASANVIWSIGRGWANEMVLGSYANTVNVTGNLYASGIAAGTSGTATLVLNLASGSYSVGHPYINLTYGGSGSVWSLSQEASGDTDYLAAKGHSFFTNASVSTAAVKMVTLGGVNLGTNTAASTYGQLGVTSMFVSGLTQNRVVIVGASGLLSDNAGFAWVTGTLYLNAASATNSIEIGDNTSSQYAYLDLRGDTTYTDYGFRVIRGNGGANTTSSLIHRGTGNFYITAYDTAPIYLATGNSSKWTLNTSGHWTPFADNSYDLGSSTYGVRELNFSDANTTAPSTEGAVRVNGTARALQHHVGGVLHTNGSVYCGPTSTDTLGNARTMAETAFATVVDIPSAYWVAGKAIEVLAAVSATGGNGAGTLVTTVRMRIGKTGDAIASRVLLATTGFGVAAGGNSHAQFVFRAVLLCKSTGSSGVIAVSSYTPGVANSTVPAAVAATDYIYLIDRPSTITLDTTATERICLSFQIAASSTQQADADLDYLIVRPLS